MFGFGKVSAQIDLFNSSYPDTSLGLSKAQYNADTSNYFKLNQSETVTGALTTFNGLVSYDTNIAFSYFNGGGLQADTIRYTTDGLTFFRNGIKFVSFLGDSASIRLFDHISVNPVRYITLTADSMNATDMALYLRNTLSTNVFFQLQNESTGFGATDGGYMRMNGLNKLDVNREAGISQFGTNASTSQLVLQADGTVTIGTTTDNAALFHVEGTANILGALSIGNTVNSVSPTAPDRTITIVVGGTTYYLHAKTTND